jgi:hypothetical protein
MNFRAWSQMSPLYRGVPSYCFFFTAQLCGKDSFKKATLKGISDIQTNGNLCIKHHPDVFLFDKLTIFFIPSPFDI